MRDRRQVHSTIRFSLSARNGDRFEKRRDQLVRSLANDATHVECVADFAIEGVSNRRREPIDACIVGSHEPCPTRTVQADRHARLTRDGTELSDGRTGAACDGEREPSI